MVIATTIIIRMIIMIITVVGIVIVITGTDAGGCEAQ